MPFNPLVAFPTSGGTDIAPGPGLTEEPPPVTGPENTFDRMALGDELSGVEPHTQMTHPVPVGVVGDANRRDGQPCGNSDDRHRDHQPPHGEPHAREPHSESLDGGEYLDP